MTSDTILVWGRMVISRPPDLCLWTLHPCIDTHKLHWSLLLFHRPLLYRDPWWLKKIYYYTTVPGNCWKTLHIVASHPKVLTVWFADKPVALQFPIWMLRAIGAPIFLNNPISGLLILIGMFITNPWASINAVIGLITAMVTALVLNLNRGDIASGGATFHGLLVGIVLTSTIDRPDWYPWVLFPVIVMAAIRYVGI